MIKTKIEPAKTSNYENVLVFMSSSINNMHETENNKVFSSMLETEDIRTSNRMHEIEPRRSKR